MRGRLPTARGGAGVLQERRPPPDAASPALARRPVASGRRRGTLADGESLEPTCQRGPLVSNNNRLRGEDVLLFARNFVRHPRMLGSVIPSSRFLVKGLLERIDWDRAKVIVEYGPGVGNISTEILRRMRPDATLIVIETNEDFVRLLRSIDDARLHVAHDSAADTERILRSLEHEKADYVISGIPFSTMPPQVREEILRTTNAVLEPDGTFIVYQFSSRVLKDLRRLFARVERGFEPLNILPARLFFCTPRPVAAHSGNGHGAPATAASLDAGHAGAVNGGGNGAHTPDAAAHPARTNGSAAHHPPH